MITIITPVHNCSELAVEYEKAVQGADQVIVVDNASAPEHAEAWHRVVHNGRYIRNYDNRWYCGACNQGYAQAGKYPGLVPDDLIIFMDSDVRATGDWLSILARCVEDGAIYGCRREMRVLAGQPIVFIDGFMLCATRATWERLRLVDGPWDDVAFQGMYWMDVELCYRATRAGIVLRTLPLPLEHIRNYTSNRTEGAFAQSDQKTGAGLHKQIVEERVRRETEGGRGAVRMALEVDGHAMGDVMIRTTPIANALVSPDCLCGCRGLSEHAPGCALSNGRGL